MRCTLRRHQWVQSVDALQPPRARLCMQTHRGTGAQRLSAEEGPLPTPHRAVGRPHASGSHNQDDISADGAARYR